MWEKAIELGKQLARMHESHMFDFMELSELLVSGHAPLAQVRRGLAGASLSRLLRPPAEKTSPVLREHHARHAAAARVLCGGVSRPGLPVLPEGERRVRTARCYALG